MKANRPTNSSIASTKEIYIDLGNSSRTGLSTDYPRRIHRLLAEIHLINH